MKGLCSYNLEEKDCCIGKRHKKILYPPEELSREDSTSITVLLYGHGSHVYRSQFSEHHIKYMHYSLREIQNALDGMSTPAHRKTVQRWERRFSALLLMLAVLLKSELGMSLETCVKCIQDYLDQHRKNWLYMLLRLVFTSDLIEFVNFVSRLVKVTPKCRYIQITDLDWPSDEEIWQLSEGG